MIKQAYDWFGLTVLEFHGSVTSLPAKWRMELRALTSNHQLTVDNIRHSQLDELLGVKNIMSFVYNKLIAAPNILAEKKIKWQNDLGLQIDMANFKMCFKDIYVVTNVAKYRSFQYCLLHRALITNVHLFHWNKLSDNLCTFCGEYPETYLHLFIYCDWVKDIWLQLEKCMSTIDNSQINFNINTVMMNRLCQNAKSIKNFMCLICKQYIYRQQCFKKKPVFTELKRLIFQVKNIKHYIAVKNNKLKQFQRKWNSSSPSPHG